MVLHGLEKWLWRCCLFINLKLNDDLLILGMEKARGVAYRV